MFLSSSSIARPVAMSCLIIALGLLGITAWFEMPVELLPKVDVPYITIMTIYPGASPEEIETDIAKKIEDSVGSIDGLKHITNTCMEDACLTFLEFELEVDVDVAAQDVREKLDLVINEFPADADSPKVLKYNINTVPIISLALTGDAPLAELYDFADNQLSDRLSTIAGVAEVQIIGGSEQEVHALLSREKLAAKGLSSLDVVKAIQEGVRTIPSGRLRQKGTEYSVKFDADYETVEAIGSLEIAGNPQGGRCYLSDLGEVVMTTEEQRQAAFLDGKPCIAIRIIKKADANTVAVVKNVHKALDAIRDVVPGGMELTWVSDEATFIEASVNDTTMNIFQGVLLTAAILFLFLVNLRSTFIVAVTMPVTIVVTLFFMSMLGYTLNISTLLSIGMSVGILVTNSIVVLESIVKRSEETGSAREGARKGSGEVAVAVLASAGTNLVVLLPIAMMGGMMGLFFAPFALTMVFATVASLFISFTLTPILAAAVLRPGRDAEKRGLTFRLTAISDGLFNWVSGNYLRFLRLVGRKRWVGAPILIATALIFVHALSLAPKLGFGMFSEADQGRLFVKLEYPTSYSLDSTKARVREVEKLLSDLPNRINTLTTIGKVEGVVGQASEGVYLAQLMIQFRKKTERPETIEEMLESVRGRLRQYPDAIVTASIPAMIGGQSYPVELEFAGADLRELDQLALGTVALARQIPGVKDPDSTVRLGKPELRVRPRRAVLSDLGIAATTMGLALRANIEGIEAASFKRGDRTYDIRVKLAEEKGKQQVEQFLFPGAPGRPILLDNLASIEENVAPVQIIRSDKQRASRVLAQLAGTTALGTAADALVSGIDAHLELPPGYSHRFRGEHEMMEESNAEFGKAALLAMLLTYLVLAATLESFKKPFIILITIPLGLIGIMWSLYLTGQMIQAFVMLGGVMLIGIVVNNAILIMDKVNQYSAQGFSSHEAMARASADELRPILMITFAAMLGMLPLAIGRGIGSELRNAIGIASVGGIGVSAVLTLIVLPVLYDMFTRKSAEEKARKPKKTQE